MWVFPEIRFLGDSIAYHARRDGQRPALRYDGRNTSYADLEATSNQLARALLAEGVVRHQRVIYLGKNPDGEDLFFGHPFGVATGKSITDYLNMNRNPDSTHLAHRIDLIGTIDPTELDLAGVHH